MTNKLTVKEKQRYSRHILLDKVGELGQQKLKDAKVLVVGAGGLGCPVLQYLTAAGVGTIGIIDFDIVDESNLQRQILFTIHDIGQPKAVVAKERLEQLNQYVTFNVYNTKLKTDNALALFADYDIVVDGTDNFSTRYLVNDACVISGKPLIYGAIHKFEGQVSVFNYENGPSYRCLFPGPPKEGSVPSCSDVGVLGILPGLIGTQQANETLKIILNIGKVLSGKLLMIDALNGSSLTLNVERSEEQVQKVLQHKDDFITNDYELFCGIKQKTMASEITIEEFIKLIESESIQIVDVRNSWELPRIDHLNPILAPLAELTSYVNEIDKIKKVVVCCQHGIRSVAAIEYLNKEHGFSNLINLQDGLASFK